MIDNANKIVDFLENDKAVKKHLHDHWISGSLTVVYPIEIDELGPWPEILVQWDSRNLNTIRGLKARLMSVFSNVIYDVFLNKNDGSCPPEVCIWYDMP